MPSRREIDAVAQVLRHELGHRTNPQDVDPRNYRRAARLGLEAVDRLRTENLQAARCAERVASVLERLGYGFDIIQRGQSIPKHN
jgi:hypothetical protein